MVVNILGMTTVQTPSQEMRKETLLAIKGDFVKQQRAQSDSRAFDPTTAQESCAERAKIATTLLETAKLLIEEVDAAELELSRAHCERSDQNEPQELQF